MRNIVESVDAGTEGQLDNQGSIGRGAPGAVGLQAAEGLGERESLRGLAIVGADEKHLLRRRRRRRWRQGRRWREGRCRGEGR